MNLDRGITDGYPKKPLHQDWFLVKRRFYYFIDSGHCEGLIGSDAACIKISFTIHGIADYGVHPGL
jgi:hypothetical protein